MQFDNPRYVGSGTLAIIYVAEYNGREYALKLNFSIPAGPNEPNEGVRAAREEFAKLKQLDGIKGIPRAYALLPGEYTLEELGLPQPKEFLEKRKVCSPILMDFFQDAKQLFHAGEQSPLFFDRLEKIVDQVHERGLGLQKDFNELNVLSQQGRPVVVDWLQAYPLPTNPQERTDYCISDKVKVDEMRVLYQREE